MDRAKEMKKLLNMKTAFVPIVLRGLKMFPKSQKKIERKLKEMKIQEIIKFIEKTGRKLRKILVY